MSHAMSHYQAVARELRAECARQKISGRELARRLGESPMWTQRRLAGEQDLTVDDLYRIADALDIPPTSLLHQAAS